MISLVSRHCSGFLSPLRPRSRGVALIIVLASLMLLSIIILAFFNTVQSELLSSKSYSDNTSSQMLANTAVNVVMAQIRQATTSAGNAWASQPGMLRTFDTNGKLVNAYRLYSSQTMVSATVDPSAEGAALANWDQSPAFFTDLNEPGIDASGKSVYPILIPPSGNVEGYNLSGAPVGSGTGANAAPMPAAWMYVLQDGSIVAPDAGSSSRATFSGAVKPSKANPIVGRVAFWTDDETCKVNVNTASEGVAWDTPRYGGGDANHNRLTNSAEQNLGVRSPVAGEYQRYPGHPAGVCLSTIFPALSGTPANTIFSMAPRIEPGGSDGGTTDIGDFTKGLAYSSIGTITPDSDRLYSGVDEFLFAMDRSVQGGLTPQQMAESRFFLTACSKAPELNLFGLPRVSIWPVHDSLATNPQSPYTTAYDRLSAFCSTYGDPADSSKRYRFYFQREKASDPLYDYANIERNKQLYGYLQSLTSASVPGVTQGFTGSFKTKFNTDRDQILTEIFDYIRCANLFDDNLAGGVNNSSVVPQPTFSNYQYTQPRKSNGANGNWKVWPGHGQVAPIQIGDTMGFGRFPTISEVGLQVICTADGNGTAPGSIGSYNDPRTWSNLTNISTVLYDGTGGQHSAITGTNTVPYTNPTLATTSGGTKTALSSGQKRLQAMILLNLFCPAQGREALAPDFEIEISGAGGIQLAGQSVFSSGTLVLKSPQFGPDNPSIKQYLNTGGSMGMRYPLCYIPNSTVNYRVSGWSNNAPTSIGTGPFGNRTYPFISNPFTVSAAANLSISGGCTIKLYACSSGTRSSSTPVQTFDVTFPSTNTPMPDLLYFGVNHVASAPSIFPPLATGTYPSIASDWWGFDARVNWASADPGNGALCYDNGGNYEQMAGSVIRADPNYTFTIPTTGTTPSAQVWTMDNSYKWAPNGSTPVYPRRSALPRSDVVRSIMSKAGDARLVACQSSVAADTSHYFQTSDSSKYSDGTTKIIHRFQENRARNYILGNPGDGRLVGSFTPTSDNAYPDVPGDVSGQVSQASSTGDWDAGLPADADGAYINKPDEGLPISYCYYILQNIGTGTTFFTPNRIVSSAGMFGSLPTWVKRNKPWTTLLFRPDPTHTHPDSAGGPKDYLMMDLFNMPVVEPYAISEPFATAGKINLNYQILPYTYITRSTALRAALKSVEVTAVPNTERSYKSESYVSNYRYAINPDDTTGTLRQFKEKFATGDIFRSAAEICDVFLVPGKHTDGSGSAQSWSSDSDANSFWSRNQLTGDNVRERPYADLYARLTTKSNTFQVHYRVQTLQKSASPSSDPSVWATWDEAKDRVTGEKRGSTTIERYLDPADASLKDAVELTPGSDSFESAYKFRIVSATSFRP